jgi:hypothetical protein
MPLGEGGVNEVPACTRIDEQTAGHAIDAHLHCEQLLGIVTGSVRGAFGESGGGRVHVDNGLRGHVA